MIQIYSPNNTDYTKNGDMTLDPTVATLEAGIKDTWKYTLTHPVDDLGRWKYIENGAIIKAPSFNGEQRFRIKETTKNEYLVTAIAEPEFMDAKDECFIVDTRPVNKTGQQALNMLIASNPKYSAVSNITKKATAYYEYKNLIEAINGNDDNSFVNRWGGEILYDNRTIRVLTRIGEDRGVEIRYGKNIPTNGFSEVIDFRNIATRVYPTSYNGYKMSGTGYVDSPLISSYPTVHKATKRYDFVKMAEDAQEDDYQNPAIVICNNQSQLNTALRNAVNADYQNGLDKPNVTINAKMVLLQDVIGYEEYANLMEVGLGDTIHCYHSLLGIITDARVTSLKYDSLQEKVTEVSLTTGGTAYNYFKNVSNVVNQTNKAFSNGANGTFYIGDKTITIDKGIITGIGG